MNVTDCNNQKCAANTFPTPAKTGSPSSDLNADICYFPEDNQGRGACSACPWHGWPTYYTIRSQKLKLKPHIKDSFWKIHLSNCSWLGILQRPLRGKRVRRCKWDWPPLFSWRRTEQAAGNQGWPLMYSSSPASTLFFLVIVITSKEEGFQHNLDLATSCPDYQVGGPFLQTQTGFVLVGQRHLFHMA